LLIVAKNAIHFGNPLSRLPPKERRLPLLFSLQMCCCSLPRRALVFFLPGPFRHLFPHFATVKARFLLLFPCLNGSSCRFSTPVPPPELINIISTRPSWFPLVFLGNVLKLLKVTPLSQFSWSKEVFQAAPVSIDAECIPSGFKAPLLGTGPLFPQCACSPLLWEIPLGENHVPPAFPQLQEKFHPSVPPKIPLAFWTEGTSPFSGPAPLGAWSSPFLRPPSRFPFHHLGLLTVFPSFFGIGQLSQGEGRAPHLPPGQPLLENLPRFWGPGFTATAPAVVLVAGVPRVGPGQFLLEAFPLRFRLCTQATPFPFFFSVSGRRAESLFPVFLGAGPMP